MDAYQHRSLERNASVENISPANGHAKYNLANINVGGIGGYDNGRTLTKNNSSVDLKPNLDRGRAMYGSALKQYNTNVSVADMIGNKNDVPWDMKSYNVPDNRSHLSKATFQTNWKNNSKPKVSYFGEIGLASLHPQNKRPSPGSYDVEKTVIRTTKKNEFWKAPKTSLFQDIMKVEAIKMSPTSYNPQKKYKVTGISKESQLKGAFMAETEYLSNASPACNKYEIKTNLIQKRSVAANMNRDRSVKGLHAKLKDGPSVHTYEGKERALDRLSTTMVQNKNYSVPKASNQKFMDYHLKKKSVIPAPNKYVVDMKTYNKLSFGPSSAGRKRS